VDDRPKLVEKVEDTYLNDLEHRIRDSVERYRDHLLGLTVDESVTRESFVSSLIEKVAEVESIESYEAPSFIQIASVDVDVNAVHEILSYLKDDKRLSLFFKQTLSGLDFNEVLSNNGDDRSAEDLGFVIKTHVTLAHCRHVSQSELRSTFTRLLGSEVELTATALFWNERVMALAVAVPEETKDGKTLPPSRNTFVHITVWLGEGASAVAANSLPQLHETLEAERLDFESPIPLRGAVCLWEL
jgi:hypothetical protein